MSLTHEDLAAAGWAIVGREMSAPSNTVVARPAPRSMGRLIRLHRTTTHLARTTPNILANQTVAKALEQELIHAMVNCLSGDMPKETERHGRQHARVIDRFEDFLAAKRYEPVHLAEMCATIGVSERTLRSCCNEHYGMGPVHYLWLRRMHLARHALLHADPATASVTSMATDFGFWELGRFSVEYRALFGESPSASLRKPPDRTLSQGTLH